MNMKNRIKVLMGLALSGAFAAQASSLSGFGDPITNPALIGGTVVNFDAGPAGVFPSVTYGAFTLTGVDAPLTIGSDYIGSFNSRGVYSAYNDFDYIPTSWRFDFATPVDAFGFNWGAADNTWTLNAYSPGGTLLETFSVPAVYGSNAGDYFGIATSGIGYALLSDTGDHVGIGDYVFIDNVTFRGTSVPDAGATTMLLGLSLFSLSILRRKSL
jgi:hypothetical protein